MKKKSFYKDLIRSIYKSKARFLSILVIITIGVAFFAGINAGEPDMVLSADKYYKEHRLSDFKVISPTGFKEEDIQKVETIEGIEKVQGAYTKDLFLTSKEGNTSTVKLLSYHHGTNHDALNIPRIIEGRMPEKSGEIAIDHSHNVPEEIKLGSEITSSLPKGEKREDFLKKEKYKVVGIVQSPLYINFERGQTNMGDGSIDYYAYIPQEDFTMEKVTDLFIATKESKNLSAYTKEYDHHIKPIENSLKDIGMVSMKEETKELKEELNKGKKELEENKIKTENELAKAEKKLQDAEKEIAKGEQELKENEGKYQKELQEKKAQLEKGKKELEKGKAQYQESYNQWEEGHRLYTENQEKLTQSKAALDRAKQQLNSLQEAIQGLQDIRDNVSMGAMTEEEFTNLIGSIGVLSPDTAQYIKENFDPGDRFLGLKIRGVLDNALSTMKENHQGGQKSYQVGMAKYQEGLKELEEAKIQIDQGKAQLDQAKAEITANEKEISNGEKALTQGEKDLQSSLEEGKKELQQGKKELAKGRSTYEKEKADALKKIKEAEIEIKDAQRQIGEIPEEWFVISREGNPGYSTYGDDAQRIGALAKVFPLFFFLVAALVCLTTMTRMIEEERAQIGILKALGYNTLTISSKYLIYALLASLVGALLGLSIGFRLFPNAIMFAYKTMYNIPERLTPFHLNYSILSLLMAVVTTVSASLLATLQELRSTPAILMQPKAPKPGKRILLERITPLWKRLSFSHKVTARNIFRYKRRFFMTVIGIAGCTALLVTGLGIRDSVNAIMGKQFEDIFIYDGQIMLDRDKDFPEERLKTIVSSRQEIERDMSTLTESVNALTPGSSRTYEANLLVPEHPKALEEFFDLHERVSKEKVELKSDSAVITEKLSELLKVKVGDSFKYRDAHNNTYEIEVGAIVENYLSHYIYMTPEYYDEITLKNPQYNSIVFNVQDMEELHHGQFKEGLMEHGEVLGVVFTEKIADEFGKVLKSLNFVVVLLAISAGALAFVVLFNLTNINITERIREIATIKVLGFRDKEVSSYVYRENIILTIIGTLVGLVLGFLFHRYVMTTMEVDAMMFGKNIHPISYGIAAILTMLFSILVNYFMYDKLKKVNMVESLKSVE
ncbi:FtsX-like permease family protein [Irregularibacter muris]|uniref:FtsX-like permease family protein n=1 Tax=Irregularibacter muris TaxID=1796619 RepID=A0AAE3HI10_9FIRM|nr:FtsX-like permease family protein [Irregularibacter muris]MCR1899314.1 FtsX-like permease family protein [Irregularibacter muris]